MDYDAIARDALLAVTAAGMLMDVRRPVPGVWDPSTGQEAGAGHVDHACMGLLTSVRGDLIDGTRILATDRGALIAAADLAIRPEPGDQLLVGASTLTIVAVETVEPGGTPIIFKAVVRG
jgi:hypothetical protein